MYDIFKRPADFGAVKGILSFSKTMLKKAADMAEEHDIHPYIGNVYDWEDAPEAFEQLRKQNFIGKLVVKV